MMIKYRVHEVAKDFDLASKDISDILKNRLNVSKKAQTALEDTELDVIFETLTEQFSVESFDEYFAMQKTDEQRATEAKPSLDEKEIKKTAEKKSEVTSKDDKKSTKAETKETKSDKPAPFKKSQEKQKKEADPNATVQSRTKGEKLVINTKASNVELDKYNERYENIASANRPANDNVATKQKLKQKSQQYRRQGMRSRRKESEADRLKRIAEERAKKTLVITVPEEITVGALAMLLKMTAAEVIKKLFSLGVMANVNEVIDFETAEIVATELGAKVNKEVVVTIEEQIIDDSIDEEDNLQLRSPVVVVMGHVDHGKTSLLDAIRHTSVTDTEAGGITQHIGAYRVGIDGQDITFLDTPGHAAFTSMRARGAMATDIAILVVAADDGIMPQTVEAINHAKAAGIAIVVAINKMDKPSANPEKILQQLTEYGLVTEEWGGDTICVPVSAKTRDGIDKLLESVLLVAEIGELKANPNRAARGIVIEARLDKGRGAIATLLVQNGTLNSGDIIVAGTAVGRVRVMTNDLGQKVETAGPSVPVEITGLAEVPHAGDAFDAVTDERLARALVEQRKDQQKEEQFSAYQKVTLDNLFSSISSGELKDLNLIVKADVQGSAEAVKQNLEKLSNEEVRVNVIHVGVGAINESDVMLANASNAIVIGFNVRPDPIATANAERDSVELRMYRVIYDCIEEIEAAIKGMLSPKYRDVNIGRIEVRNVFKLSTAGVISGSYILDGKVTRNAKIRLIRDGIVITEDEIDSLRRFKDDVKEVHAGYECGIGLKHYNDIKEGDIFEAFITEEYRED